MGEQNSVEAGELTDRHALLKQTDHEHLIGVLWAAEIGRPEGLVEVDDRPTGEMLKPANFSGVIQVAVGGVAASLPDTKNLED